jgi:tRNA U34 5-methylaminomethyl-2-thiouridine-forming methyltransferase MnmC
MTKITKIITDDGSITFRNEDIDECYHTKSGAMDEALRKHVIPSNILEFVKKNNEVNIGDICFGLGYNSIVAINEILKVNLNCKINLFAYENDTTILNQIKEIDFKDLNLNKIRDKIIFMIDKGFFEDENLKLKLFLGDFRVELNNCNYDLFDVVFFDPFSPGKVPELWSLDVLELVYSKCKKDCVLTTYSCARIVKDNLKDAGFLVEKGPCVGRRSPSTIARKN